MAEVPKGWLEAVRQLVDVVQNSDSREFEIETRDFALAIRRKAGGPLTPRRRQTGPTRPPPESAPSHFHLVLAPLTGVFFRSQTPSAKPYCSVGDWVGAETVIGLIETMKIFNEVTADHSGRVVNFHAQVGDLVQAGTVLATLDPLDKNASDAPDEKDWGSLGPA